MNLVDGVIGLWCNCNRSFLVLKKGVGPIVIFPYPFNNFVITNIHAEILANQPHRTTSIAKKKSSYLTSLLCDVKSLILHFDFDFSFPSEGDTVLTCERADPNPHSTQIANIGKYNQKFQSKL